MASSTIYSPEYLAENNSAELMGTSVAFLVLETACMGMLWASRYVAKGERGNFWMEGFMTATYVVCVAKITVAFCELSIGICVDAVLMEW